MDPRARVPACMCMRMRVRMGMRPCACARVHVHVHVRVRVHVHMLFPTADGDNSFYRNVCGVTVGIAGCVLYGHLKHASSTKTPDVLDCACPGIVLQAMQPKGSVYEPVSI